MNSRYLVLTALLALLCSCGEATGRRLGGDVTTDPAQLRIGSCRAQADLELIEDMEDGNQAIKPAAGRSGSWFSFNDGTGTQTPKANTQLFPMTRFSPPRGTSQEAVHTSGSGFTIWGAGVGFELASTEPYDASGYAGIAFWARGAEGLAQSVRINVTDRNTSQFGLCDLDCPTDMGPIRVNEETDGICTEEKGPCHDYFGADFGAELSADWKLFRYRWGDLEARNWSNKNLTAIVASEIYGMRIQADSPGSFDFWLDDIAFICP